MVAKVHHATAAKAAKSGFIVTGEPEDTHYTVTWPERNKRLLASTAVQGVDDMLLWRMLTVEYPGLRVQQGKDYRWAIQAKGSEENDVIEGETLEQAWDAYTNAVEGGPNA